MAKPKLALIPAAQGDKFYSVLPSDGVGDFTFARASTGTRIAPTGLIEEVTSGDSRLNYDLLNGKVVNCPHYLLEPARTNLIAYSEDFTNGWNLDGVTVLSDNVISPDGSLNADKITFVSGNERLYYIISTSSAVFSIYLKGENITFRALMPYAHVLITIIAILSLNFYLNYSLTKIYSYPLVAYPFIELRHFIFTILLLFISIAWKNLNWIGFNVIFGVFKYLAPCSYAIYISHHYLVVKATYLNFISNKIIEYGLYIIFMILFSYFLEVIVYHRIKKMIIN